MDYPSPSKIAQDLADDIIDSQNPTYEERLDLLRKTSGVNE
jgi:hypothetical protein